ncbi:hypothetical protein SDC9_182976 [bioreactor metagenome]|uniref:Uncharacterized protein n=1 Tax=bioreactor metagenome TaxID=1076179 RepID=A0A645H929_9ZZZZ
MDQHAVHLVVPADLLAPVHALFDANAVGRLAIGSGHFVHIVVDKAEGGGVDNRRYIDAVGL